MGNGPARAHVLSSFGDSLRVARCDWLVVWRRRQRCAVCRITRQVLQKSLRGGQFPFGDPVDQMMQRVTAHSSSVLNQDIDLPMRAGRSRIIARMAMELTAVYRKVPEGYIAFLEELPGANTQDETLDEARQNLNEAVALVLESNRALAEQSLEGATVIREAFVLSAA